jgi:hypothetical protein
MGLPALLPTRKEGALRIFIALKNPSPWPCSNPQRLGPVTSTLTTTPPRRLLKQNSTHDATSASSLPPGPCSGGNIKATVHVPPNKLRHRTTATHVLRYDKHFPVVGLLLLWHAVVAYLGPCCQLGTVPRAYNTSMAHDGMEEKIKIKNY